MKRAKKKRTRFKKKKFLALPTGAKTTPAPAVNLHFIERYKPFVDACMKRFPGFRVWGGHIHDGDGYAVYISDGTSTSMFQLRSLILVNGKPVLNDLMEAPESERENYIQAGFKAMEESLLQRTAQVKAGARSA